MLGENHSTLTVSLDMWPRETDKIPAGAQNLTAFLAGPKAFEVNQSSGRAAVELTVRMRNQSAGIERLPRTQYESTVCAGAVDPSAHSQVHHPKLRHRAISSVDSIAWERARWPSYTGAYFRSISLTYADTVLFSLIQPVTVTSGPVHSLAFSSRFKSSLGSSDNLVARVRPRRLVRQ